MRQRGWNRLVTRGRGRSVGRTEDLCDADSSRDPLGLDVVGGPRTGRDRSRTRADPPCAAAAVVVVVASPGGRPPGTFVCVRAGAVDRAAVTDHGGGSGRR